MNDVNIQGSVNFDSFRSEDFASGRAPLTITPAAPLESSRYSIRLMSEQINQDTSYQNEYIEHADRIKQQIQTYGRKEEGHYQELFLPIQESPVLDKRGQGRVYKCRLVNGIEQGDLRLRVIPMQEDSVTVPNSVYGSRFQNSSYLEPVRVLSIENSADPNNKHFAMLKTVGKYSEYAPQPAGK